MGSTNPSTMQEEEEEEAIARETKKALAPKRGKMSGKSKALLIITSLLMMGVFRTGFIFIIIGLLPSIVAYYIDITAERYTFKTIFACNLCGMIPHMETMLIAGPSSTVLQSIMGNAGNWMIIYGSAVIGWLLVEICPIIAGFMITGFHQTQIGGITRVQKKIENEWGPEVVELSSTAIARAEDEE